LRREMQLIGMIKRLHEGGPLTNRDPAGGLLEAAHRLRRNVTLRP
jgi:hypothetical protein